VRPARPRPRPFAADLRAIRARAGAPGEVEAATLRAWVDKMVGRLADADRVLAGFRRAELLAQLPEVYFTLRGRWWLGPKAGLA